MNCKDAFDTFDCWMYIYCTQLCNVCNQPRETKVSLLLQVVMYLLIRRWVFLTIYGRIHNLFYFYEIALQTFSSTIYQFSHQTVFQDLPCGIPTANFVLISKLFMLEVREYLRLWKPLITSIFVVFQTTSYFVSYTYITVIICRQSVVASNRVSFVENNRP